jgi:hypothetical protein
MTPCAGCGELAEFSKFGSVQLYTLAAERQVPDFVIGPRNKKQRKKRSTIEIPLPNYKLVRLMMISTQNLN